jgi:hypothetical protein
LEFGPPVYLFRSDHSFLGGPCLVCHAHSGKRQTRVRQALAWPWPCRSAERRMSAATSPAFFRRAGMRTQPGQPPMIPYTPCSTPGVGSAHGTFARSPADEHRASRRSSRPLRASFGTGDTCVNGMSPASSARPKALTRNSRLQRLIAPEPHRVRRGVAPLPQAARLPFARLTARVRGRR